MHVNRIMQRLIFDSCFRKELCPHEDSSSENDQVPYSRWSTSDKINGRRAAVVPENCVVYVCARTRLCVCGCARAIYQTFHIFIIGPATGIGRFCYADNRFKLTPRR